MSSVPTALNIIGDIGWDKAHPKRENPGILHTLQVGQSLLSGPINALRSHGFRVAQKGE